MRTLMISVVAVAAMAFATTASANSITLELSGGGSTLTVSTASVTVVVDIYANFTSEGGGQVAVGTTIKGSAGLAPVGCKETNTQSIGAGPTNATWGRLTANCGAGSPGDGGIVGNEIRLIEQELKSGANSQSGTILIGSVTFHVTGTPGVLYINATYNPVLDGFAGADAVTRAPTSLGSITVNVIPEPATVALLATGMLGLLGFSRRRKR